MICQIDIPSLQDRSKGDAISKGLAMLQAVWFLLSCISSGANHLVLTELEISTLAFTMVSFVLYVLWWDKPQSVAVQVLLHPNLKLIQPQTRLENKSRVAYMFRLLVAPLGVTDRGEWRTHVRVPSMWWTD